MGRSDMESTTFYRRPFKSHALLFEIAKGIAEFYTQTEYERPIQFGWLGAKPYNRESKYAESLPKNHVPRIAPCTFCPSPSRSRKDGKQQPPQACQAPRGGRGQHFLGLTPIDDASVGDQGRGGGGERERGKSGPSTRSNAPFPPPHLK